ncbi:hypothetical protein [Maioricimonas sp. JC845]|uniref:hypothetical protein n=1 Tax=Maioricimonas sp. JC845 TaxID=3232138 RepID=UPI00345A5910
MRAIVDHGSRSAPSAICRRLLLAARQAEDSNRPAEARAHLHAAAELDDSPRSGIALARFTAEQHADDDAAIRAVLQVWFRSQSAGHRSWQAVCCRLLQAGYRYQGDMLAARQYEQLAISAWCDTLIEVPQRPVSPEILREAAALAALWESWDLAAGWLAEGLPHANVADLGEWEINLGAACLRLGRWDAGRRHLLQGFVASVREGDAAGCGHALKTLGHGYVAQREWSRAGRAFRVAARWYERASLAAESNACLGHAREAVRLGALQHCDPARN